MPLQLVVLRPYFDRATMYMEFQGYAWIQWAKDHNIPYIDLNKKDDVKAKFDPAVKNYPYAHICNGGHGNATQLTGQDYNVLLDSRRQADLDLIAGRSGAFLSCTFGKSKDVWLKAGMRAFMGYEDVYTFVAGTPARDDAKAGHFFEAHRAYDFTLFPAILGGSSYKDGDDAGYAKSQERYRYWASVTPDPYERHYMLYDAYIQVHGAEAPTPPPPPPPPEGYARTTITVDGAELYDESRNIPVQIGITVRPGTSSSASSRLHKGPRGAAS